MLRDKLGTVSVKHCCQIYRIIRDRLDMHWKEILMLKLKRSAQKQHDLLTGLSYNI